MLSIFISGITIYPISDSKKEHLEYITYICSCVRRILYTHKYLCLLNFRGCYILDALFWENIFYLTKRNKSSVKRDHNSQAKVSQRRIQVGSRILWKLGTKQEKKASVKFLYKSLCDNIFSFLLAKFLGEEWFNYMTDVYIIFQETAKLFSKVALPSYIPPQVYKSSFIYSNNWFG